MAEPRSNVNLFEEDASRVDSSELLLSSNDDRDTNTPHLIAGHTGAKDDQVVNESSFIFMFPVEENLDKFGLASALMRRKKETSPATISDAVEVDATSTKVGNCSSTQSFSKNPFEALFTYWTGSTDTITFSRGESSCNLTSLSSNEQASASAGRDLSGASRTNFSSIATSESVKVMTANGAQELIIEEGNIQFTQSKESKKSGPFLDERNVNSSENLRKVMTEKIARLKLELLLREKKAGAVRQGKSGIGDTADNAIQINEVTDVIMNTGESDSQGGSHDTGHVDDGGVILSDEQALRAAALRSQKKRSVPSGAKSSSLEENSSTLEGKKGSLEGKGSSLEDASDRAKAESALRESALRSLKKRTAGTRDVEVEVENEKSAKLIRIEESINTVRQDIQKNDIDKALLNSMDCTSTSSFDCSSTAVAVMNDIRLPDLEVLQCSDAVSMDVRTSNLQQESVVVVTDGVGTVGDGSRQVNFDKGGGGGGDSGGDDDDDDDDHDHDHDDDENEDVMEVDNDEVDGSEGEGGDGDSNGNGRVNNDYGGDVIVVDNNESNMQIATQSLSRKRIVTIEANGNREQGEDDEEEEEEEEGGGGVRGRNREDEKEGEYYYEDNKESESDIENEDAEEIQKEINRMRIVRDTLHYKLRPYSLREVESVLGSFRTLLQINWINQVDTMRPDSELLADLQKIFKKYRNADIHEELRLYTLYNTNVRGQESYEVAIRYFEYLTTVGSRDCPDGRVLFVANYLGRDARECARRLGLVKICRLYPEYFTVIHKKKKKKKNDNNDKNDNNKVRNNNIKNNCNNNSNSNDNNDGYGEEKEGYDNNDMNIVIKIKPSTCLNEMEKLYDSISKKRFRQKICLEFLKMKQEVTMKNPNYWKNMTEKDIKCVRNFHYNKEKMLRLAKSIHAYMTLYPTHTLRQITSHFCTGEINSTAHKAMKYLGLTSICVTFDQLFEVQNVFNVKDLKIIPIHESQSERVENAMSSRQFEESRGREDNVCSKDEQTCSFANANNDNSDMSNNNDTNNNNSNKSNINAKTNTNANVNVNVNANVNASKSSVNYGTRNDINNNANNNNKVNNNNNKNNDINLGGSNKKSNNNNNTDAKNNTNNYNSKNTNTSYSNNIIYGDINYNNNNSNNSNNNNNNNNKNKNKSAIDYGNKNNNNNNNNVDKNSNSNNIVYADNHNKNKGTETDSEEEGEICENPIIHQNKNSSSKSKRHVPPTPSDVLTAFQSRSQLQSQHTGTSQTTAATTATTTTAYYTTTTAATSTSTSSATATAVAQTSIRIAAAAAAAAAITKSKEREKSFEMRHTNKREMRGMEELITSQTESTPHSTSQDNPESSMSSSVQLEQQQQLQLQLQQEDLVHGNRTYPYNALVPAAIALRDFLLNPPKDEKLDKVQHGFQIKKFRLQLPDDKMDYAKLIMTIGGKKFCQAVPLYLKTVSKHGILSIIPVPDEEKNSKNIQDDNSSKKNEVAKMKEDKKENSEKIALIKTDGTVQHIKKYHLLESANLLHQYLEKEALRFNSTQSSSSLSDYQKGTIVFLNYLFTYVSFLIFLYSFIYLIFIHLFIHLFIFHYILKYVTTVFKFVTYFSPIHSS